MVRQPLRSSSGHSHAMQAPDLFSAANQPSPLSPRFWAQLVARHPLVLLGSLWLVMVCLSALAYHRLMVNDSATVDPAPSRSAVQSTPRAEPRSPSAAVNPMPESGQLGTQVGLWGLASLVGLSSLGCYVISQQTKAARRRPPKTRSLRASPQRPALKPSPTGPKRLAPYKTERDGVIVKGARAVVDIDLFASDLFEEEGWENDIVEAEVFETPATHSLPAGGSAPVFPSPPASVLPPRLGTSVVNRSESNPSLPLSHHRPSPPPPAMPAHPTTVVPEDEPHPLDWPEESLAHSLDMRQRRSLSSLM